MSEPKREFKSESLLVMPLELQSLSKPAKQTHFEHLEPKNTKETCIQFDLIDRVIKQIKKL